MKKFIVLTFLLMGWGYYELSGGAEFVPEQRVLAEAEAEPAMPAELDLGGVEIVTRAAPVADAPLAAPQEAAAAAADVTLAALTEPDEAAVSSADIAAAVAAAVAEPAADPLPLAAVPTPVADLRAVTGNRVNLREGPGRDFAAIDQLTEGERVTVIASGDSGWVQVEVLGTGLIGWMSADFLGTTGG